MPAAKGVTTRQQLIPDQLIAAICARLADNKRVRRRLPVWGRVHIDRQLPFLCVYRRPLVGVDEGTARLVTSEASYLLASGVRKLRPGLTKLVQEVARTLNDEFGAFLIVELWAAEEIGDEDLAAPRASRPAFRVVAPKQQNLNTLLGTLAGLLSWIKTGGRTSEVEIVRSARWYPKQFSPILPASVVSELGCTVLGLEVRPVYRDHTSGEMYPLLLGELRRGLTRALRRTFFEFARSHTTHRPKHFHTLGRRAMVKAVWESDRQLAEVADSFDFLLQVTPINAVQAWRSFERSHFERAPVFHYRPLPVDPTLLKRRLYNTPIERIEDPALVRMFREKQYGLDRKITLLLDLNTARFLHGSMQLFGGLDNGLHSLAEQLLERLPPRTREDSKGGHLDAESFALRAEAEIDYYRQQWSGVDAKVQIREDVAGGLMVSNGSLLIAKHTQIPATRVYALLQHEIGTHILTYYNGRAQPFRQLYSGLAGYDATQEGLAVLTEYLVGGLSRPRMRLLAGRVVAARCMIDGGSFIEAFRLLHRDHGFDRRVSFNTTLRIYRGGGLTKDVVYLRGLRRLLQYLAEGGELDTLFLGKFDVEHVPMIRELRHREVLRAPPLSPRYLSDPQARTRLARLGQGFTVLEMI